MKLIDTEKIFVSPERQRKEFEPEAMAELFDSIKKKGLLHPVTVNRGENGNWELLAGERRLRVVKDHHMLGVPLYYGNDPVPEGKIPALSFEDLDELQREELQLDENLRRKDLTWQERVAAVARVAALRDKQAAAAGLPRPTLGEIAAETYQVKRDWPEGKGNAGIATTSKQLIVARHLTDDEVVKAKNLDEAYKILVKRDEKDRHAALSAQVGKTYSTRLHTLVLADCRDWMRDQPPNQFDCVVVDPPYGIGADQFGDSGGRIEEQHEYKDDRKKFEQFLFNLQDVSRLCKPAAHIYVFCDVEGFRDIKLRLGSLGWTTFRTPLVMHKLNSGRVPIPDFGPRRQYELVAYAYRGGKKVTGVFPDVFATNMDELLGHGAQKPIEGYIDLLKRSCYPGERVFDPYCGSGTIFAAATALQLYATAVEEDAVAHGLAAQRLREL